MSKGGSFPSKYFLRVLCEVLKWDLGEMEKVLAADKLRAKYGIMPISLSDPSLVPVEQVWSQLTPEQKKKFTDNVQDTAKQNRRVA
jgi:hypothetical protein